MIEVSCEVEELTIPINNVWVVRSRMWPVLLVLCFCIIDVDCIWSYKTGKGCHCSLTTCGHLLKLRQGASDYDILTLLLLGCVSRTFLCSFGYYYLDQQNNSADVPMCPGSTSFPWIILHELHQNIYKNDIITPFLQMKKLTCHLSELQKCRVSRTSTQTSFSTTRNSMSFTILTLSSKATLENMRPTSQGSFQSIPGVVKFFWFCGLNSIQKAVTLWRRYWGRELEWW